MAATMARAERAEPQAPAGEPPCEKATASLATASAASSRPGGRPGGRGCAVAAVACAALAQAVYLLGNDGPIIGSGAGGAGARSGVPAVVPEYTLEMLQQYDGQPLREGGGLLLAVWGRVFNVSSGAEFYAPKQTYGCFAGKDSSWAFAKTKRGKKYTNKDLNSLEPKHLTQLNETYWGTYRAKYPIVGVLIDPPYDPTAYDAYAGPFASIGEEVRRGLRWLQKIMISSEEMVRMVFGVVDRDRDGFLTLSEFNDFQNLTSSEELPKKAKTAEQFARVLTMIDPDNTEPELGMSFASFENVYQKDAAAVQLSNDFNMLFPDYRQESGKHDELDGDKKRCPMRKVVRVVVSAIKSILPRGLLA